MVVKSYKIRISPPYSANRIAKVKFFLPINPQEARLA
jgi:hypothetical protein